MLLFFQDFLHGQNVFLHGEAHLQMGKGEAVTTTVLAKICKALDCNIGDIMEFVDDED